MISFPISFERLSLTDQLAVKGMRIDVSHASALESLYVLVPNLEIANKKRSNEFYSGRWCAGEAIYEVIGQRLLPMRHVDRSPIWPKDVVGSITHTDEFACAMVARADQVRRLGIDLELVDKVASVDGLDEQIASVKERDLFNAWDKDQFLSLLFSAKESLFKALYPECRVYFDYLDAEAVSVDSESIVLCLLRNLNDSFEAGNSFNIRYHFENRHIFTYLSE